MDKKMDKFAKIVGYITIGISWALLCYIVGIGLAAILVEIHSPPEENKCVQNISYKVCEEISEYKDYTTEW